MALSVDKTTQQARQLQEHRDELKARRSYGDTDLTIRYIRGLSTILHSGVPIQCLSIYGYSIFRCDSLTKPDYAGACIYALNTVLDAFVISSYSLHTLYTDKSKDFSISMACIYRPEHDKTIFDHIENLSFDTGKNTFIAGDFNFGDIRKWPLNQLPAANSPFYAFVYAW
ncbi:hypothetical protein HHI36_010039 [Cryptolaemus montrouzieri]|uniref:Pol-like protein n=1 Tax=Cryptolaemus montrouzieri TaxID=559131 RepID=A0ABD2MHJ7_9CUCU